ncbi:hypothetical protein ETB97_003017 [Aspergillus alliaceus]|uniref:Uncharacterized protein n=1 Tax=Petromyces alliaceus TaxID=209559 RepID=A0A8H6AEL1_PETAA|nr:hypothetical protein ETB97_003017 [Aspergillus burnettii]
MSVFVWFFIPETKGLSLEKMDELFGVANATHQKTQDEERGATHVEGDKKSEAAAETRMERA